MTRRDLKDTCAQRHAQGLACRGCDYQHYVGCVVKVPSKRLLPREYPDDILDDEVHLVSSKAYEALAMAALIIEIGLLALLLGLMLGDWLWEVLM